MKLRKQRSAVFFFLTILILLSTSNAGYGQDKGQAEAINPPLSERTPQVRDAIVEAVPGVNDADNVTAEHLAAITTLRPGTGVGGLVVNVPVTALKSGDFNGLTALTYLNLSGNGNPIGNISVLEDLTTLTTLYLVGRSISDLSFLEGLTNLKTLYLTHNSVSDISSLQHLTALTELSLGENSVTDISVLANLTKLKILILDNNSITDISALENFTQKLTHLSLAHNSVSDISMLEHFTTLETLYVRSNPISDYAPLRRLKAAVAAAGSNIRIDLNPPIFNEGTSTTRTVAENTASGTNIGAAISAKDTDDRTLTYSLSGTDAAAFSIVSTSGQLQTSAALDFETKSSYSVTVDVSDGKIGNDAIAVRINLTDVNEAPVFPEDTLTTLSVAENTAPGRNIGAAFTATDPDSGDTLTYSLRRGDRNSFSIDPNTGQLRTRAALDYETKNSYTNLAVRVTDSSGLTDAIVITINVTDVNEGARQVSNSAPVFTDGDSTTRTIAENTVSGRNIGSPVAATDADTGDTLIYTLGGTDAAAFSIVSTSGQLQTSAALDYETKTSYSVRITVSDSKLTDTIDVTINVTDVNENRAPAFAEGTSTTRSIAENTAADTNIGSAVSATDPDNDTLTYTLGGADAASFSIVSTSGQLQTKAALDYETKTSYSVSVSVSDGNGGSDSIAVTINVTDVNENRAPAFTEGTSTTRSVAENTAADTNIGSAVSATDPDDDTLTYTLSGADAASFSIVSTAGQLQTKAALDYETKTSYSVTITVSDSELTDTIDVTINVTDVNENRAPAFNTSASTTRSIAENTASGVNIGSPVTATDADTGNTLTYTLSGTDAAMFSIVSTSGQLKTRAALNYESKASYSVKVDVSDGNGGSDSIPVTISVTDVNEAPSFANSTATRSIAENTAANTNIGSSVSATDPDDDTLTYTLGGADAAAFSIVSTSGQLQTKAALDHETKASYSVTVTATDGGNLSDTTTVIISVTDVNEAPNFATTTATRSVAENTAANTNIGSAVSATDPDTGDTLTYTLGGRDASSFSIVSTSGQLQTRAALNYETKTSHSVTISVSDGEGGTDTIDVTINVTDVYEPIIRRTQQIQDAIVAAVPGVNHADDVTPAHLAAITRLDLSSKSITSLKSGDFGGLTGLATLDLSGNSISNISPLRGLTKLTTLDLSGNSISNISALERLTKLTRLHLSDNPISDYEPLRRLLAAIDGIEDHPGLTLDINIPPMFTEGTSTTRAVAEYTPSGQDIGAVVSATDVDSYFLTYSLGGTDADAFSIDTSSGQLQTFAVLNYQTKSSYSVTVSVFDGNGGTDSITVTIYVTDVNEALITPVNQRTQQVRDAIIAAVPDVNHADDVTPAHLAAITELDLSSKSITSLKSGDFSGLTALITLYLHDNSISDVSPVENLTALIKLTLAHTSISEVPPLEHLTNLTDFYLNDNSIEDISPLKNMTSLKFLILDDTSISDISPLKNLTNLDNLYLNDNSIKDISALKNLTNLTDLYLNDNSISDISPLKNLTNLEDLHLYNNSIEDISPLENMTSLVVLGVASNSIEDISPLENMTSLIGLGLKNNSISDISPLENMAALVWLSLKDNPISDYEPLQRLKTANPGVFIDITLNNNPPQFTEGNSTTRSVAENTAAGTNIGEAVTATDADNHPLAYSLSGTDADAFDIVSTSGQLKTKAALDYETQDTYTVTVTAYDGNNGGDRITVTITVTDAVGAAPSVETLPALPQTTELLTNFPNPFNPETWIPYQLAKHAEVTLTIYDIRGRVVRELKLGHQPADIYHNRSRAIHWDGRNAFGEKVATGIYFYTLKAGDYTATRKLLIRK